MIRECKTHGFVEHFKRSDYGYRCRACNTDRVRKHRNKKKKWCIDYLGGKCSKCGYNKCIAALEFHHKDDKNKEFDFSHYQVASYKKLENELKKCELLCANCHREVHWGNE